jgi:hypothetical protein
MPCYDSRSDEVDADRQERLTAATRAACDMWNVLKRGGSKSELSAETVAWLTTHDLDDARRLREEFRRGVAQRVRERALSKLDMDERRALGL